MCPTCISLQVPRPCPQGLGQFPATTSLVVGPPSHEPPAIHLAYILQLVVDSDNDHTARDCHIMVMRNEFGYFLDEGLEHINIWCSDRPLSAEVIEAIIRERLPCEDYLWFVNPPQYQSIKAVRKTGQDGIAGWICRRSGQASGPHG